MKTLERQTWAGLGTFTLPLVLSWCMIAVTSDDSYSFSDKGVWLVDSQRRSTFVGNITTYHLEGVVTLPNDVQRWGPWAGKIITGDERFVDEDNQPKPLIYAISTNGTVTTSALGIGPEDFDIIPPNQDLYCVDLGTGGNDGKIRKLSRTFLTNYVGDLVITQAGEFGPAKLFIVHWDATNSVFVTRIISHPDSTYGHFEHVTFAPVDLPPLTP